MKIKVNREYVTYLSRFCAKTEERKFLMGIKFDLVEKSLCATDGHRLVYIKKGFELDGKADANEYIIQFHTPSINKLSKKIHELELTIDGFRVWFGDQIVGIIIDGAFPPFKHLIDNVEGKEPQAVTQIGINPDLIKDFYWEICKMINGTYYCGGVKMTFYGEESAIKIDVLGKPEIYGLLMPIRLGKG